MTMITRLASSLRQLPVRWPTVALFGTAIAYVDGFWVTAIQGTVGAVERSEPPLTRWLRDATLMLPLVALAVLVALVWARRWAGGRGGWPSLAAAALLLTLLSSSVSIAEVAASSAYDYSFQTKHLELLHSYGAANQPGSIELAGFEPSSSLSFALYCNLRGVAADSAVAQLEYATLLVHVRALWFASILLLITNLVIVVLGLALRYERLWTAWSQMRPPSDSALA